MKKSYTVTQKTIDEAGQKKRQYTQVRYADLMTSMFDDLEMIDNSRIVAALMTGMPELELSDIEEMIDNGQVEPCKDGIIIWKP